MFQRLALLKARQKSIFSHDPRLCGEFGPTEIIGAAIEVHRAQGPGLLESAYRQCLCDELQLRGLPFVCERPLAVSYKGLRLDCGYRVCGFDVAEAGGRA